jgi:hypothetical protein
MPLSVWLFVNLARLAAVTVVFLLWAAFKIIQGILGTTFFILRWIFILAIYRPLKKREIAKKIAAKIEYDTKIKNAERALRAYVAREFK